MLISLNWIKEFVDLPEMSPKELATRFTLTTAEVEGVSQTGQGLQDVTVVQVKDKRPHPEADKLNLVTFETGQGLKEVVCGASNVRGGMKVFYAPIGTELPSGLKLEPKKIRGVLSDGMLCSSTELGLGAGVDGLLELPESAVVGMKFPTYMKQEPDVILEVDNKSLTHRPDLWGMYGLAREFAAAHGKELKNPYGPQWSEHQLAKVGQGLGKVKFSVESDSACWAYFGINVQGVQVVESPVWMQQRLQAVGLRPINSLVDISNYVMLELGMPNHIFDADKIAGEKLFIKKLSHETSFTTLDGQERHLTIQDTVIADESGPSVLAGIMGGQQSGVTAGTKNIFVEVANWDPSEIRKTSVRLGLRSDSSQRYEKTLDSRLCDRTLLRILELILELNPQAKAVGEIQKWWKEESLAKPLTFEFKRERMTSVLGHELSSEQISAYFRALGFDTLLKSDEFKVTVPSWRTTKDISCVDDLVEEIGRMVGYDNIVPCSPLLPVNPVRLSPSKALYRKLQDFMTLEANALEVMTYPLVGAELLERVRWPLKNEKLTLVNALSVDHDRMRPSLVPSAIVVAAENQKHFSDFSFFEYGRAYLGYENERSCLMFALYSREKTPFVDLLNHTDKLLSTLGLTAEYVPRQEKFPNSLIPYEWGGCHPHEYVNLRIQGKFYGAATTVHPLIMREFKAKGFLSLLVIDLTDFENRELRSKTKYSAIAKFPVSNFDVSVVAGVDVPVGEILKNLSSLKLKQLKSVSVVGEIYPLSETQKSITLRTVFEDPQGTLSAEFLSEAEKAVVQTLEKAGFPLRS